MNLNPLKPTAKKIFLVLGYFIITSVIFTLIDETLSLEKLTTRFAICKSGDHLGFPLAILAQYDCSNNVSAINFIIDIIFWYLIVSYGLFQYIVKKLGQILKPSTLKLIIFTILFFLSFWYSLSHKPIWNTIGICIHGGNSTGFPFAQSLGCLKYTDITFMSVLANSIFWYLLTCVIIEIYKGLRKKLTQS